MQNSCDSRPKTHTSSNSLGPRDSAGESVRSRMIVYALANDSIAFRSAAVTSEGQISLLIDTGLVDDDGDTDDTDDTDDDDDDDDLVRLLLKWSSLYDPSAHAMQNWVAVDLLSDVRYGFSWCTFFEL